MKLAVIGTGYVGLVVATRFAESGNDVICVDHDGRNIEMLQEGQPSFDEPAINELIARNRQAGRLRFTADLRVAVRESQVIFVAVGSPQPANSSADRCQVRSVIDSVNDAMTGAIEPRRAGQAMPPADQSAPLSIGLVPNPMW